MMHFDLLLSGEVFGAEPLSCSCSQDITLIFWNPDSLPCQRERATGPYSEPDESSPQPFCFINIHFDIIFQ